VASAKSAGLSKTGKVIPLFNIVKFDNEVCAAGTSGTQGTCYTADECEALGGKADGKCASDYGVCCVVEMDTCGSQTSAPVSYLVSPDTVESGQCDFKICKAGDDICRIKLEFDSFEIAQPTTQDGLDTAAPATNGGGVGDCVTDTFTVTSPGNAGPPVICGKNSGQHMWIEASDMCNSVNFNIGGGMTTRNWNIKVTQVTCNDEDIAPAGCLQYFTAATGRVSSFNFDRTATAVGATATHLSNQRQTMCWRKNANVCRMCLFPQTIAPTPVTVAAQTSFGLSGSPDAGAAQATVGTDCTSDYLLIERAATEAGTAIAAERFCGRILAEAQAATAPASVCTEALPFQVTFISDFDELDGADAMLGEQNVAPTGSVGFDLVYKEFAC